jgi:hypothetical protein
MIQRIVLPTTSGLIRLRATLLALVDHQNWGIMLHRNVSNHLPINMAYIPVDLHFHQHLKILQTYRYYHLPFSSTEVHLCFVLSLKLERNALHDNDEANKEIHYKCETYLNSSLLIARQPQWAWTCSTRFLDHTPTIHTREDSSGRVIGSSQRPDNTQHSFDTHTHPCRWRG